MCLTAGIRFPAVIFIERRVITMSLIQIKDLTFSYEGSFDNVFEHAHIQLDTDWRLGFTGHNGMGKTTLLKLLLGEYDHRGSITASVGFSYFPFTVPDKSLPTIYVAEEILPDLEQWRLEKEISLLGLKEDVLYRPFVTLSNGEQTKVLLALLFLKEDQFLLIDEPTNHLDLEGRRIAADYLSRKKGFILVSHDRAFLDRCTDHILSLENTGIKVEKGNFSTWYANKKNRDAYELAENKKLKKEVNRLEISVRQTAGWSNTIEKSKKGTLKSGLKPDKGYIGRQAAKMMKRSKATVVRRENALAEKEKLLQNLDKQEPLKLHLLKFRTNLLVSGGDLALFYGTEQVCRPFQFSVLQGDRVALTGANGSGKSTLLKLILGEDLQYTGELYKPRDLRISYVPQDATALTGTLETFCESRGIDESLFKTILRKLGFRREQFKKPLQFYSLGQKKKAAIAASLCQQAHLYLWDEPLNYIDVISRMQIESLLLEYRPTILFVEHDQAFVKNISTKALHLQ